MLFFHLKNHYALIFALREWVSTSFSATAPTTSPTSETSSMPASDLLHSITGSDKVLIAPESHHTPSPSFPTHPSSTSSTTPPPPYSFPDIPIVHRQLLTARKGQRPTIWIDFNEAIETMLGWEGYKIMALSYTGGVTVNTLREGVLSIPPGYEDQRKEYVDIYLKTNGST